MAEGTASNGYKWEEEYPEPLEYGVIGQERAPISRANPDFFYVRNWQEEAAEPPLCDLMLGPRTESASSNFKNCFLQNSEKDNEADGQQTYEGGDADDVIKNLEDLLLHGGHGGTHKWEGKTREGSVGRSEKLANEITTAGRKLATEDPKMQGQLAPPDSLHVDSQEKDFMVQKCSFELVPPPIAPDEESNCGGSEQKFSAPNSPAPQSNDDSLAVAIEQAVQEKEAKISSQKFPPSRPKSKPRTGGTRRVGRNLSGGSNNTFTSDQVSMAAAWEANKLGFEIDHMKMVIGDMDRELQARFALLESLRSPPFFGGPPRGWPAPYSFFDPLLLQMNSANGPIGIHPMCGPACGIFGQPQPYPATVPMPLPPFYPGSAQGCGSIQSKGGFLDGYIFLCSNGNIMEFLTNQVFGAPSSHFLEVERISLKTSLFLLNFEAREIFGPFKAESSGRLDHDSQVLKFFPAQVRAKRVGDLKYLSEPVFKPAISDNYYKEDPVKILSRMLTATQVKKLQYLFKSKGETVDVEELGRRMESSTSEEGSETKEAMAAHAA